MEEKLVLMMIMMRQIKHLDHKLIKVNHSNRLIKIKPNLIENNQSTINDKLRSPAIAIVRSNNRAPPQVEPFFRPRHLPALTQQQPTTTRISITKR